MRKMVVLLLLAAFWLGACTEMNSGGRSRDVTGQAALCAMCGATVTPDYFYYGSSRAMGPGNY